VNTETELQRRVQDFLDRVAAHLGPAPDDEKRELLSDLESHIHEALESRLSGRKAAPEDLQAVLAEMDPPESYGEPAEGQRPAGSGKRTLGLTALCISLGSLLVAMLLAALVYILVSPRTSGLLEMMTWIPAFLFFAGQITALVLGILSWSSPFGKAAVITSSALIALTVLLAT